MAIIKIFDTTLRDGEQSAGVNLNFSEKLEIARQLERLNVDIIEAGFPAASKGDFASVQNIAQTIKNCSVTGLARAVISDIDAAWGALKDGAEPRIHTFLATSPIHRQYKLRKTKEEVVETAVETVKYAASKFPIVQWSAEDATRTELPFLAEIIEKVIQAGARIINIPDTVGYTTPQEYGEIFQYLRNHVPSIDKVSLSAHCHDDLGMAIANSLSAIKNGATQIEGTINGIGERAGNAALEELAVALYIRNDHYQASTRLNLQEISRTSSLISKLTGMVVPANKAIVGRNAFAHESGIHQDGVLKEKTTYEIISPDLVGFQSNSMVLGKHSGRHAFKNRLSELGLEVADEEANRLFTVFKDLADRKKEMTDDDLAAIVLEEKLSKEQRFYDLIGIQIQYGTNSVPTATVTLSGSNNEVIQEAGTGAGSIEALYNTLEKCLNGTANLLDYRIQSVGAGRDALAQVYVKLNYEGMETSGRGLAQDVLEASSKAYLNAVNRVIYMREKVQAVEAN
ncbi:MULTISPECIES: 2-isopropylmalate synthase [Cytobacillus]|uniref:2-isopropylmalate synthase n=1 Tax=Cytobacillus firmus TaxID=1399 RepID=A0AA46P0R0_CYTFI|nr:MULTISPECIES: 2-isopropylmalate synthase [Cytobacillus]KML38450.1 2-isopropylmalate synthase [Cytobacillus firmus]MCC3647463.1 2-isopropylmalate synthase [Cytobacillus oceanisediminis]MCS0654435.1 2-isopropylmalate synthase [Cytobacillus firmus]UYG94367.1 2-isopropylmalate synthase [Cytobacillus firmus]WHY33295.1 2-isopropylmalate synthase [Cytobacillus firmus]